MTSPVGVLAAYALLTVAGLVNALLLIGISRKRGSLTPRRWLDISFALFLLSNAYTRLTPAWAAFFTDDGYRIWEVWLEAHQSTLAGSVGLWAAVGAAGLLTFGMVLHRRELAHPPADEVALAAKKICAREHALDDTLNVVGGDLGVSLRAHHRVRTEVHMREAEA
jgi:hypothetical protein